jgi:arylsulfatase
MNIRKSIFLLATLAFGMIQVQSADRPNILIIMSDDVGFSDIGCYGGEIQTPNLDALAADGVRFTQFYNTGRCCPTRASLLTGLYPHQTGVGHMMNDRGHDGYRGDLNEHCVTIAQVLKPAGYATYWLGKWHPPKHTAPDGPYFNLPLQRGFDRFFGTIHGAGSLYDPDSLTRDNTQIAPEDPDTFYYTDAISDHAVSYIDDHEDSQPFFMYVAYTAAHWPMHAKPEDIEKYKGRYERGWDALRSERYQRMIELGLIRDQWKLSGNVRNWAEAEEKLWQQRRMEVYAAMLDSMDQGIGRIVSALEQKGELDNTLILYLQDNGGCQEEFGSRGDVRPDPSEPFQLQPMEPEELQTRMVPKVTRDGRPVRQGRGVMPGPADTYIAYGIEWANASNTPFRMYKHFVHEGGIATPLIAHWPRGIQRKNAFERQPAHLIDLMATCVDLAQAEYPARNEGEEIHPMEGVSLVPAFQGKPLQRENPIYWEHERNRAIRMGNWKLVAKADQPWELYDMKADRSEIDDLSEQYPKRAEEMAAKWEDWAHRAHVLPWP